jgi:hypothetical protein
MTPTGRIAIRPTTSCRQPSGGSQAGGRSGVVSATLVLVTRPTNASWIATTDSPKSCRNPTFRHHSRDERHVIKGPLRVSPKSKKSSKVTITKSGKVTIQTMGRKKLTVTLKLTAPATDQCTAYAYTKNWRV